MMYGLSLHQYTTNEGNESPATGFGEDLYMDLIHRCLEIEEVIDRHMTIMDRYDPDKSVALVVDEWGAWHKVEEGTNPGFLYQQNTLRDAMVAALSLNYFNERCERIKMANLSQTVNVLQAMILTEEAKMLKTPTYHVFDMYQVHHDATLIPVTLESPDYAYEETSVPMLSVSASRSEADVLNVSIVNVDPHHDSRLSMDLRGIEPGEISGRILTAGEMDSHNTFDAPDQVKPNIFEADSPRKGKLDLTIPAKSIVVLEIQPDL